jgi:uncharacterized membrane protein YfcA
MMMMLPYLVLGLAAGSVGGLLGVGGGIIHVPALVLFFDRPMHLAVSATLLVNVAVAIGSVWGHRGTGRLDWRIIAQLAPGAVAGAVLGALLGSGLPQTGLRHCFALFALIVSIYLFTRRRAEPAGAQRHDPRRNRTLEWGIGGSTGLASGLLGVGGGIVAVPAQNLLMGIPFPQAVANASGLIIGVSGVAAITAWRAGLSHGHFGSWDPLHLAAFLAPGAMIGGHFGARCVGKVSPLFLQKAFALLLAVTSLCMMEIF